MIGKLFTSAAIFSLATMLALGGFLAYLAGTGRLTAERAELVAQVLRGELDDANKPESTPTTTAPAEQPQEVRVQSADQVRAQRKREHLERLEIERALADLQAQRRLLDHVMQQVVQEQEQLVAEKKEFNTRQQKLASAAEDEGFQREVEYLTALSSRQSKEHLVRVWQTSPEEAVRLLAALDVNKGRRILEELRTPQELDIQTDLLERIRSQGLEGYADASGKTAADAKR